MKLDGAFLALSHPTRRQILEQLEKGERSVGDVTERFSSVTRQAVYKHLRLLEAAGFIESEPRGRSVYLRLKQKPVQDIDRWMEKRHDYWTQRLESLKAFVENEGRER